MINRILSKKDWKVHEIAELTFQLNGKPLSLKDYNLMHPLYDKQVKRVIYKTGRQVTKSTTLANIMVINCFYRKYFKTLFVAPLEQQVYRFSNLYINPLLNSPLISSNMDKGVQSVKVKTFKSGSTMFFGYCQNGVDRLRSISVDEINWDEIQDILYDHIPVVQECMSASDKKWQRFCGTPKTKENTIEYLWLKSSQNEPAIKCSRCNKTCIPDEDTIWKMISEDGPICYHCKKLFRMEDILNPIWIPANELAIDKFEGYHIPQIFVARNLTKNNWQDIWQKYNDYPKNKFANEVLGISYDTGGRILTITELNKLCVLEPKQTINPAEYINICAGVDWGITAVNSFTVLIIVGLNKEQKWEVIYFHKFLETEPTYQIKTITYLLNAWSVSFAGCDFGVGHANNDFLRKRWCGDNILRVLEFNYVKSKFLVAWNKRVSRFSLNRSLSLSNLFMEIKEGKVLFPKTEKIEMVFSDILAEYEEITEGPYGISKVFRHSPTRPDDFLHALNFAIMASKQQAGMVVVDYRNDDENG